MLYSVPDEAPLLGEEVLFQFLSKTLSWVLNVCGFNLHPFRAENTGELSENTIVHGIHGGLSPEHGEPLVNLSWKHLPHLTNTSMDA